jgi:hypothetical protein
VTGTGTASAGICGRIVREGRYGRGVADFSREDLRGSRFERVDLSGSEFRAIDLTGSRFHGVEMSRIVMRGVGLFDVDIHGEIANLTINGVDVGPLVNAELDRRYPDRFLDQTGNPRRSVAVGCPGPAMGRDA